MTDEQTNPTDTTGATTTPPVEISMDKTPLQKLREENDELEKEIRRAQKMRTEALLAGTAGGRIEGQPKEITPKEYANKLLKGQVNPLKDDGFL